MHVNMNFSQSHGSLELYWLLNCHKSCTNRIDVEHHECNCSAWQLKAQCWLFERKLLHFQCLSLYIYIWFSISHTEFGNPFRVTTVYALEGWTIRVKSFPLLQLHLPMQSGAEYSTYNANKYNMIMHTTRQLESQNICHILSMAIRKSEYLSHFQHGN